VPSESTLEALEELRAGGGFHYASIDEFLDALDSWSD